MEKQYESHRSPAILTEGTVYSSIRLQPCAGGGENQKQTAVSLQIAAACFFVLYSFVIIQKHVTLPCRT